MKRFSISTLCLGLALALAQTALSETLKKPEIDKLVAAQQAKASPSFRAFLAEAAKAEPRLKASVAAYEAKAPLAGDDVPSNREPCHPLIGATAPIRQGGTRTSKMCETIAADPSAIGCASIEMKASRRSPQR